MTRDRQTKFICLLACLSLGIGLLESRWAQAASPQKKAARAAQAAPAPVSFTGIPVDVKLLDADSNPTLRFPVAHSSLNWTVMKPRIKASYGWLEIDRGSIRYNLVRASRTTKEQDQSFTFSRASLLDVKTEYSAAEFRAGGLRHFLAYSPPSHWDAVDAGGNMATSVSNADSAYTPLILRALEDFDGVVAEVKRQMQAAAPPPVVVQPAPVLPAPAQPVAPPPAPTLVIMAPSGASENQTLEVNESSLTIRGVAMADSGLPTVTINGAPSALRPKGASVVEFWSDPITLKPGNNPFDIVATSPARATAHFQFVARFTPKAAPVNPRALGKDEIISLLQGGVPDSRVAELVRDRGIKFAPTSADFNDVRAAGGSEYLVKAIQQAAPPVP